MSRHGYIDGGDTDPGDFARWRGAVNRAARGARGQRLLRDLIMGLERMPRRELHEVVIDDGENACALGVVGRQRGVELGDLNPKWDDELGDWEDDIDDYYLAQTLGARLDIAKSLAREIMFENDESPGTPVDRWRRMYAWACRLFRGQLDPFAPCPCAGASSLPVGAPIASACSNRWSCYSDPGFFPRPAGAFAATEVSE